MNGEAEGSSKAHSVLFTFLFLRIELKEQRVVMLFSCCSSKFLPKNLARSSTVGLKFYIYKPNFQMMVLYVIKPASFNLTLIFQKTISIFPSGSQTVDHKHNGLTIRVSSYVRKRIFSRSRCFQKDATFRTNHSVVVKADNVNVSSVEKIVRVCGMGCMVPCR